MAGKIPNDIYQYSLHTAFKAGLTTAGPRASHLPGYGTHGIGYTSEGKTLCLYDGKPMIFGSKGEVKNAGDEGLGFIMVSPFLPESSTKLNPSCTKERLTAILPMNRFNIFTMKSASFTSVTLLGSSKSLSGISGTVFGFTIPTVAEAISGPSVRCVFWGKDGGELVGGEVEEFETAADEVRMQWSTTGRFHLGFPHGDEFDDMKL